MLKTISADTPAALEMAIQKTQNWLLTQQHEEGFWVGELEADASVTAGYIPFMYFMTGQLDSEKRDLMINYVRLKQQDDGSWNAYHDGPGDLNVSIQVYFALKLAGVSASAPYMQSARQFILSMGGVMKVNTITRIWLALFGQYDYRGTPSIPPEIALLPDRFFFNIYEFASWSRETIMALMLILSLKPVCKVPENASIDELYVEPAGERHYNVGIKKSFFSFNNFFLTLDATFKMLEKRPIKPLRQRALNKIEKWIVTHQETDGSWGGIMLPWLYSLMALKGIGYKNDHPVIAKGIEGILPFIVINKNTMMMQPAVSPVWDTAWSILALKESGIPASHPSINKACRWQMNQEIRKDGDWKIKNPGTDPGGWAFEFHNDFYPDIDDTAVVAKILLQTNFNDTNSPAVAAAKRGLHWVKKMQSNNGGWAAFDRDSNKRFLADVPYADFMTPLDPTSPDVTAHAIELLSEHNSNDPSLKRGIDYLKRVQESDGSWYGRWGVNYIYGTGLVLLSLKAAKENMFQNYISRSVDWLEANQNTDGGWGETCETYDNPSMKCRGPSTPSQTAWSLMGLIASGRQFADSVSRGIDYLLTNQNEDGSWTEKAFTGTGFPKAFYLRYDLYRIYFPLLALASYKNSLEDHNG